MPERSPAALPATAVSPLRFWMGMAQMFLAGSAFLLLLKTGLSAVALACAAAATTVTVTSRWLFRRRR